MGNKYLSISKILLVVTLENILMSHILYLKILHSWEFSYFHCKVSENVILLESPNTLREFSLPAIGRKGSRKYFLL